MISTLNPDRLAAYRADTFRTRPGSRVNTFREALDFVNQRGFCFFWPISGVDLPSLWTAVAGNRPVADEHDDPGHITWSWKDESLGKAIWYYGRALRRRNTLISLQSLPFFYALSPNYGDPENDYLYQYQQGQLTAAAKNIYEALLREGPLDSISLRKAAMLSGSATTPLFSRALDDLMMEFKVLPVGVSSAGAWHYSHIYNLVPRQFPDLAECARQINEVGARAELARLYLLSVGAARINALIRLFGWSPDICQRTILRLEQSSLVVSNIQHPGQTGEWVALRTLLDS